MLDFIVTRRLGSNLASCALSVAMTMAGPLGVATTFYAAPAFAQTVTAPAPLTPAQAAAVQTAIQNAISNVDPALTGAAHDAAVAQAISTATTVAIATYGAGAVSVAVSTA